MAAFPRCGKDRSGTPYSPTPAPEKRPDNGFANTFPLYFRQTPERPCSSPRPKARQATVRPPSGFPAKLSTIDTKNLPKTLGAFGHIKRKTRKVQASNPYIEEPVPYLLGESCPRITEFHIRYLNYAYRIIQGLKEIMLKALYYFFCLFLPH